MNPAIPFFVIAAGNVLFAGIKAHRYDRSWWIEAVAAVMWLGLAMFLLKKP